MQETDAEWEQLTQAIQADQERLACLQQHLAHLRLVLALANEQPSSRTSALTTQVAALGQQLAQLEHQITLENARRSAVTRQFEQARLALAALRRSSLRQEAPSAALARKLLNDCIKRLLRGFRSALQKSCEWSALIPSS